MTYDVHTHIGLDAGFYLRGWWPYGSTAADLLVQMDAHGIDRAVCFPFTLPSAFDPYAFASTGEIKLIQGRVPFDRENELLRMEIDRLDKDKRLIQFAMFDPGRRVDEQMRLIERLIGRISGLKAQTTVIQSNIRALLDEARPIMELARRHNLPVLIHTSVAPSDKWAQAADCLEIARAFPDVRFNLAHSLRFHEEHLRTAANLSNVWVDCSAHLAHCELAREDSPAVASPEERLEADYTRPARALAAVHEVLGGRCLWGSDNPFMSWCADRIRVIYSYEEEAAVLHELPADVRRSIASEAPEAWLFGRS
jgi:predicted TIM-barrel fold metal-dependent hydrolase